MAFCLLAARPFPPLPPVHFHVSFVQGLVCGLAIDHIPGPSTCQVRALVFGDLLPLRGQVFPSPPPLHTLVPTLCSCDAPQKIKKERKGEERRERKRRKEGKEERKRRKGKEGKEERKGRKGKGKKGERKRRGKEGEEVVTKVSRVDMGRA